jgi:hypothetical protein
MNVSHDETVPPPPPSTKKNPPKPAKESKKKAPFSEEFLDLPIVFSLEDFLEQGEPVVQMQID